MKPLREFATDEKVFAACCLLIAVCVVWILCEIAEHLRALTMRPPVLIVTEPAPRKAPKGDPT